MKYIFIADFFKEDVLGGGEIVNDVVISALDKLGHDILTVYSRDVNLSFLDAHTGSNFIIGNFLGLTDSAKRRLGKEKYVIYEHDHKYLKTRDPSPFEDFKAPKEQIINRNFYTNALSIVCQSALHTEVLQKNLGLRNIINSGGNPWTEEELDEIERLSLAEKEPVCAVMNSKNHIKNTQGAVDYCAVNGLKYRLISSPSPVEFLKQMSVCENFVFFPMVLETYSRVVVEARMLGCKITTNNLVGATSESWFELQGAELIAHLREQRKKVVKIFVDVFQRPSVYEDITVILNAYRRPANLEKQVQAIRAQTCPPKQIWVWVNDHEDLQGYDFSKLDVDRVIRNDYNWKFYGRFAAALLAETKYVAIFDDDTIPGVRWFENCLDTMRASPGILGSAGVILDAETYNPHTRCGWPTQNVETTEVDLVGHAWYFEREWLKYLWSEPPTTWDNGEDMQFSYLAQKHGAVKTYCPPHPPDERALHGSIYGNELGMDAKATSTNTAVSHGTFFSERDYCVKKARSAGWSLVRERTK